MQLGDDDVGLWFGSHEACGTHAAASGDIQV